MRLEGNRELTVREYPNGNPSLWLDGKCITWYHPDLDLGKKHIALRNIVDGENVYELLNRQGIVGREIFELPNWLSRLSVCELLTEEKMVV